MRASILALAAVAIAANAQAPTFPRLYTYYMVPPSTTWAWQPVEVDSPITLTVDSAGLAHLASSRKYRIPATFNGTAWTLPDAPRVGSLECYLNGVAETGFTLAGAALTFSFPTSASDQVTCSYDR